MCNAYELGKRPGSFPERIRAAAAGELLAVDGIRLIRRTDPAPVVLADGEVREMRWGFDRPKIGTVNNARADKLGGRMWSDAFRHRRCLIPALAFYEWSGPKGRKTTHRFTPTGDGWFWIAGLWEDSDDLGPCYSMITTEPNRLVRPIHNRMPALLADEELPAYLRGELDRFEPPPDLLRVAEAPNPLTNSTGQGELF
jgi:putative SOS response-associated peptidase YedK